MSIIAKTRLFKYTENFTSKTWKFLDNKTDIFHISAQNTDCWFSLEPPRQGGSDEYPQSFWAILRKIMYTHVNPSFTVKVGFYGVKIISACFRDWLITCFKDPN